MLECSLGTWQSCHNLCRKPCLKKKKRCNRWPWLGILVFLHMLQVIGICFGYLCVIASVCKESNREGGCCHSWTAWCCWHYEFSLKMKKYGDIVMSVPLGTILGGLEFFVFVFLQGKQGKNEHIIVIYTCQGLQGKESRGCNDTQLPSGNPCVFAGVCKAGFGWCFPFSPQIK